MDASVEHAFVELKRQLEVLDYVEPLGIESAPLVRRLFEDLVLTTENYEVMRQKADGLEAAASRARERLGPLERENARLVRENNQLHLDAIRQGEDHDRQRRAILVREQLLREELANLRFVSDQDSKLLRDKVC